MILVTLTGTAGEIFNTVGSLLEELEGGAGKGGGGVENTKKCQQMLNCY